MKISVVYSIIVALSTIGATNAFFLPGCSFGNLFDLILGVSLFGIQCIRSIFEAFHSTTYKVSRFVFHSASPFSPAHCFYCRNSIFHAKLQHQYAWGFAFMQKYMQASIFWLPCLVETPSLLVSKSAGAMGNGIGITRYCSCGCMLRLLPCSVRDSFHFLRSRIMLILKIGKLRI